MPELWVTRAGLVEYESAWAAQKALALARHSGEIPDLLLLLEHPPVYTKGPRTSAAELPMGEDWYRMQGIEVTDTDRGGWVTYHGPGQLVAYPIVSLRPYRDDVAGFVRRLERVMIASLAAWDVPAQVIAGLTGVWTAGSAPLPAGSQGPQRTAVGPGEGPGTARKIGSIGIHVSRGVTTHGLAINVNNDLQPFEWIVPCAIDGVRMTSLCRERGSEQDLEAFATTLAEEFGETYGRDPVDLPLATLVDRVAGAAPLAATSAPVP
jgi:lipoyl(octanoyl) transferase